MNRWMDKKISTGDRTRLRDLAARAAEIAGGDENRERIRLWKKHNQLAGERPMILLFPEGGWREILPEEAHLQCRDTDLRKLEDHFVRQLYTFNHFLSDNVMDTCVPVQKVIQSSGWGLEAEWTYSAQKTGARAFKPVLLGPTDLDRLRKPVITHDEAASKAALAFFQELLGDLIPVRLVGIPHISFHFHALYSSWRGLNETYMDFLDQPDMLHQALAFLRDGYQGMIEQYVAQDLFDLNHNNTYHSSGGLGWLDELPGPDPGPGPVRPANMWGSAESQELAPVSPAMHTEFAFEYERPLLEQFALTGYGCCEALEDKLDMVFTLPNIRRISISPFADVDKSAERMGNRAIYSWKPQPSHLVGDFDPARLRAYVDHTLDVCSANGCTLEIILKDTHGCDNHPERFDRWSEIARDAVRARE